MGLKIYRLPREVGIGLWLFVNDVKYDGAFPNCSQMREWFRTRPKHLVGYELSDDTVIIDTEIIQSYGQENKHHVIRPVGQAAPYMVIGAGTYMHDELFDNGIDAFDLAAAKSEDYDNS
ncbi:hypothetical protein [Aliirhizobium cellulosilyticum]|uniref:Uncharacterized protein n=1 Tax=Aliirhizobium cellulosilyticum TaxID=393664 RepID=A0A7W6SA47_9HYPH|nr:hypothetical protein [Rhizobium cellulosilyticum]MBB4349273.1 hypothetical protein [Rhizobium cellulosilyticum]MBB4412505.1 hypothetical protein [Rhizobium cellulosilyticum]MBB4447137.1 hypothetical protein [Rhizobium cellulosilyticum]